MAPRTAPRPSAATCTRVAAAAAAAVLLAGCGGDEPATARTVTVTTTSSASPDPTSSAPTQTAPTGDVAGRAHDVGTITAVEDVGGTTVLTLDRWTYADWPEERVASEGVPLTPLTDNPFRNQNDTRTYDVPVSPDVVVGVNSCTVGSDQQPRIATTAGGVDDLVAGDTIWLLTYSEGRLTKADSAPVC